MTERSTTDDTTERLEAYHGVLSDETAIGLENAVSRRRSEWTIERRARTEQIADALD